MKRLNDTFLEHVEELIGLKDKHVLEIGCGNGSKSAALAQRCEQLIAIDPDATAIAEAQREHAAKNCTYAVGKAENLNFRDATFDIVIFSLSLHHVPIDSIEKALAEAVRVVKPTGRIVVLEPAFNGTFFESEIRFGASDGDERKEKAAAYYELLRSTTLTEVTEFWDEITFVFDSDDDFKAAMEPKFELASLTSFLQEHQYILVAQRRINIYAPVS